MDPLVYTPAHELLQRFGGGELSPVDVLEAQIAKAAEVEPKVNAFCDEYFDEALQAARLSEQRYADGTAHPLEGITVAVKDDSNVAGKITTLGSTRKDMLAEHDHPLVERLREAGAVIHARTNVPEMMLAAVTWSTAHGVTRNPWNLHYTCGGSSGGSGASLAAGTSTLATGSDIGGSIRIPASLQGLYGFKPPFGRVAVTPPEHLVPYASYGPLARNITDLTLFERIIAGPHRSFPASAGPAPALPDTATVTSLSGVRIAYDLDLDYKVLDPEIERATLEGLARLEELGATIEEVDLGWDGEAAHQAIVNALTAGLPAEQLVEHVGMCEPEDISPYLQNLISHSRETAPDACTQSGSVAAEMYAPLFDVLSTHDVFVCPTVANQGVPADYNQATDTLVTNGVEVDPLVGWICTYPFNLLPWNPAMSVPTGRASNGVPTGMQIVGNNMDDAAVFRVASAYAAADPGLFSGDAFPDFRDTV